MFVCWNLEILVHEKLHRRSTALHTPIVGCVALIPGWSPAESMCQALLPLTVDTGSHHEWPVCVMSVGASQSDIVVVAVGPAGRIFEGTSGW